MAAHQVVVDAVLTAVKVAEDASTPSKTLANNANQSMHDRSFAKSMLTEYLAGIRDTANFNGSAILEELKGEMNEILKQVINS